MVMEALSLVAAGFGSVTAMLNLEARYEYSSTASSDVMLERNLM